MSEHVVAHRHTHVDDSVVEGLWIWKVSLTEVQIQADCSSAVGYRVSVKWR